MESCEKPVEQHTGTECDRHKDSAQYKHIFGKFRIAIAAARESGGRQRPDPRGQGAVTEAGKLPVRQTGSGFCTLTLQAAVTARELKNLSRDDAAAAG